MHSESKFELLLAAVIIARSTSYLFSKTCLNSMEPFSLLAVRFSLAFLLLIPFLFRRIRLLSLRSVLRAALLGGSFFAVMTAETFALSMTASSTTALLENTAIVFVPLFAAAAYRKRLFKADLVSALIAFCGVVLIILPGTQEFFGGSASHSVGMLLGLLSAVLYAGSIVLTDDLAHKEDPLALGVLQVGFMAGFSLIAAFLFETPRLPESSEEWGCIVVLAVVCTGFGFTLQPLAQSGTSPERAGLFCALNPAVAAVLGWIFLNERMGLSGILGAILILLSMAAAVLSERHPVRPGHQ